MLMLAAGGAACSDIEFLASQPRLFGPVASDSTLYRTIRNITPTVLWAKLRPGNARANTVTDHLTVVDAAIEQLPPPRSLPATITATTSDLSNAGCRFASIPLDARTGSFTAAVPATSASLSLTSTFMPVLELPIIDIGPLLMADGSGERVDALIGEAVERHGAFMIAGFADADRVDDWATAALEFFELDDRGKNAVGSRGSVPDGPRIYRGYRNRPAPGGWAYNEFFDIGPAVPFPAPSPGMAAFAEENVWPHDPPAVGWRNAMESYYALMLRVGTAVMLSAGRWAGFSDDDLMQRFDEGNSTLRLLHYPEQPADWTIMQTDPNAPPLSAVRHTDASGVSLLWQRDPGLQAEAPDGTWRTVPVLANGVSVHLGTVLEIMTGGRVRATPHRVLDLGTGDRKSVGFFVEPGLGTRLAPIGALASAGGTYGAHLQERFHATPGFEDLIPAPS